MVGPGTRLTWYAPLGWISVMGVLLVGAVVLTGVVLWKLLQRGAVEAGPTWGCGYAAPSSRMQYTSSSFAQMLVGLFGWALRPKRRQPVDLPLFPQAASFQ
jgi:hypothetical protein